MPDLFAVKRELFITGDGSPSFRIAGDIPYHSKYGALQESLHVFIQSGLVQLQGRHETLHVLEIGLGTGLNAVLTAQHAMDRDQKIFYTALEPEPLTQLEITELLETPFYSRSEHKPVLRHIHEADWGTEILIHPAFKFLKYREGLLQHSFKDKFHVIYFDAFDPVFQTELWTGEVFKELYDAMFNGGILVTYSSKVQVRRNMVEAGFVVEKIPGPPHKREITRARKPVGND